jgi:hypothetical protein
MLFALSCVGRKLAIGSSPVQVVPPIVHTMKKLEIVQSLSTDPIYILIMILILIIITLER